MATIKRKARLKTERPDEDDEPPLTAAERRAFARYVRDMEDRTRYLLASVTLPGFSLYYRVQDDAWSFDDPTQATLFKRRAVALRVLVLFNWLMSPADSTAPEFC